MGHEFFVALGGLIEKAILDESESRKGVGMHVHIELTLLKIFSHEKKNKPKKDQK